jgi:hypothetical protein
MGLVLGVFWEGGGVWLSERGVPGGLITSEANLCPAWHPRTGCGGRREWPERWGQIEELGLRQRVKAREARSLAWSQVWGGAWSARGEDVHLMPATCSTKSWRQERGR